MSLNLMHIFLICNLILWPEAIVAQKSRHAPPIRIVVIDSGIGHNQKLPLCPGLSRDFTRTSLYDTSQTQHGPNVAAIIHKYAAKAPHCFIILKVFLNSKIPRGAYIAAMNYMLQIQPDIVNLSMAGTEQSEYEAKIYKKALDAGARVIAAAGNDGQATEECKIYPACADPRITVVGSNTGTYSNSGPWVTALENGLQCGAGKCMQGTSQATAVFSGKLVRQLYWERLKWAGPKF